jgi:hypothetical protein
MTKLRTQPTRLNKLLEKKKKKKKKSTFSPAFIMKHWSKLVIEINQNVFSPVDLVVFSLVHLLGFYQIPAHSLCIKSEEAKTVRLL